MRILKSGKIFRLGMDNIKEVSRKMIENCKLED